MEARWPGSAGFSGGEGLRPRLCYRCNTASRRQTFFCVRSQKPAGLFFRIGKIPEDKSGVCVHLPSSMGGSAETRGGERRKGTPRQMELTPLFLAATPASASGPERGFVSGSESESGFDPASRPASSQSPEQPPQRLPRWLERAELFLRVLLRMYIGLAICYVPWSRMFWEQNPLFAQLPALSAFAANGAVRGVVSGLGILNLWIAFQDALHYRDE